MNFVLKDKVKSKKIAEFILSTYSCRILGPGKIEGNAFLQRRRSKDEFKYRVFNVRYLESFSSILKRLNAMFKDSSRTTVNRYVSNQSSSTENYIRLGYFLEILELGTFEIKGGENPMVFIRLNDPERIESDSKNKRYSNTLLNKTDGLPIRNILRTLNKKNRLSEIPQTVGGKKNVNINWFFLKTAPVAQIVESKSK